MALAITSTASSGDFPEPTKLPVKKELPDPLVMFNGKAVATKEQWEKERRPELKKLFQHYMYGTAPEAPKVNAKIERTDPNALGGKATLKEITLTLQGIDGPRFTCSSSQQTQRPRAVFVGIICGNHAVLDDPKSLNTNWIYANQPGVKNNRHRRAAANKKTCGTSRTSSIAATPSLSFTPATSTPIAPTCAKASTITSARSTTGAPSAPGPGATRALSIIW